MLVLRWLTLLWLWARLVLNPNRFSDVSTGFDGSRLSISNSTETFQEGPFNLRPPLQEEWLRAEPML